ncbi:hypothetical protein F4677DRAFT_285538 [Hypoxylon crocopeplum]|nr:hypothetical protein F4677DRAFT_285538 [Hypoxylon crocopeplum]
MASLRESGTLGTYQRYKLGQAQFQKWLKQTSDKIRRGSSGPEKGPEPASASSVHWSQLESMTRTVIDNLDPEQIPQSAISILRDVVHLRKKSAQFFGSAAAKSDDDKLKQKNSTHEYIIKVLEKILHQFDDTLSKIRPSAPQASPREDGQLGMNDINNMFEYLKLEESRDAEKKDLDETSDVEAIVIKRPKKFRTKGGKKQKQKKLPKEQRVQKRTTSSPETSWIDTFQWVEDEDEEDDFDYYMLVYCFFQDFNSVRTYVGDRWTEYFYYKSVSIDTLAVVTNAACEIFHEMEYELEKILKDTPPLAQYGFMMDMLFFDYGLDHVDYSGEDQLTESERNYKILSEADWLGFFAYSGIIKALEMVPPGKVPMVPTSAFKRPEYGPRDFDGFRQFTIDVVNEFFPECCLLKAMKKNAQLPMIVSAQDELTLDFEDIFRVRGYSSATVFDMSLYIDIRYILEDQVANAFNLLQTTAARMRTTLEDQLPNIRGPWDLKKECRNRLAEVDMCIIKDFVEEDKARRFEEKGMMEPFERHFLLKRDPIWSGLLDFRCRLVLNNLGYRFINESLVVVGAAFLYAASRLGNIRGLHWPQMDRFLEVHGEDRILQGALLPELAPIDLLKRLVDCDLSVTDVAPVSTFSDHSKSLEALHRRYAWEDGRSRQSMAYLRDIIRDKFDIKAGDIFSRQAAIPPSGTNRAENLLGGEDSVVRRGPPNLAEAQIARKGPPQAARVSPVQLLEIIDETTTSLLETHLSIDYFLLHNESVQLLRKLIGEFSSEAENHAPSLLDADIRVDRLVLLLPAIYRSMVGGSVVEITKRLQSAVSEFCSNL